MTHSPKKDTAPPRILILYNAWSRHRRVNFGAYLNELANLGAQVEARMLSRSFDFKAALADAHAFDRVVVAGGDGTVSGAAGLLLDTGIPIMVYPGGTANLLARNLGMPSNPKQLAQLTVSGATVETDLGEVEYVRYSRRERWRKPFRRGSVPAASPVKIYFSIMAGCGFAARLMLQAQSLKSSMGQAAYWLSAMWNFFPRRAEFHMKLDGKPVEASGIGVLVVNFEKIQFDLKVVSQSLAHDGKFEIAVLKPRSLLGLTPLVWGALLERFGLPRRSVPDIMETYRATDIEISSRPPLRLQCDGEVLKKTWGFKVRMHPRGAVFVCGPHACSDVAGSQPLEKTGRMS
jgi:diacylglycerol kinase family enzyme